MELQKIRSDSVSVLSEFQVVVPSAILLTITVLIDDVLVIWLVHQSLLKIGALLSMHQVINKKTPVRITGRTHGPVWFRYTQALLKILVFAASVTLGLSFLEKKSAYGEGYPGSDDTGTKDKNLAKTWTWT